MQARLKPRQAAPEALKSLIDMREYVQNCGLDQALRLLVEIRISQINGCAYCVDLHSNEARTAGLGRQRLDCLCVWRDVGLFDARERAALAWAESLTLLRGSHVPDEVYADAHALFGDRGLMDLTMAIVAMNGWNRLGVGFRMQPAARTSTEG